MGFEVWLYTLASVLVASAISFIGILTIAVNEKKLEGALLFMVSFAVGALFGDAFIHLIPEAFDELGTGVIVPIYIMVGVLMFFALEKFVRWRHCHVPTSQHHPHPVATMNIIGEGAHCLFDGMIIAASYMVSIPIGIATTLAVVLHEIPHKIGDFGVLLHSGMKFRKALTYTFLSALTSVIGGMATLLIGTSVEGFSVALMPITAGGFIYIAGTDLTPELHHEVVAHKSVIQFISIILGLGIMLALLVLMG